MLKRMNCKYTTIAGAGQSVNTQSAEAEGKVKGDWSSGRRRLHADCSATDGIWSNLSISLSLCPSISLSLYLSLSISISSLLYLQKPLPHRKGISTSPDTELIPSTMLWGDCPSSDYSAANTLCRFQNLLDTSRQLLRQLSWLYCPCNINNFVQHHITQVLDIFLHLGSHRGSIK